VARRSSSTTIGVVLIAAGVLAVAARSPALGALPDLMRVLLLFAVGAAAWWGTRGRLRRGARIALIAVIGAFAVPSAGRFAGVVAIGFPALAFALVYLASPRRWWALLPAGVLASVALVAGSQALFPGWNPAPLLFLGFAATFTTLYLLPRGRGGQRWALAPALLWIVLTVLVNSPSGNGPHWLLPAVLIGAGVFLLSWWRGRR
jgi:hypothetical protein